jgi:hypothetical protein
MVSSNPPGGRHPHSSRRSVFVRQPKAADAPTGAATPGAKPAAPAVTTAPATPSLRLVGAPGPNPPAVLRNVGQPITSPTDPRWVLALRTAESLQGALITPEKRQRLVRLGQSMGLTAFDANLVIAIVQDQARRGYAADYCPTAGELQLQMVPLPRLSSVRHNFPGRRALMLSITIAGILAAEIAFFRWILGG